jgi:hypothetical protein
MLMWHRRLWLIDHGAALYFHHAWKREDRPATNPFALIKDHVLLKLASKIEEVDAEMKVRLTPGKLAEIVELVPDEWLPEDPGFADRAEQRQAYLNFFVGRLRASDVFVGEVVRARSSHL